MTTFEDEIREALKVEFDTGSLKEAGTADEIFRLIKHGYPISGSKIDWRRIPGAIECFEEVKSKRPERFIQFFDEVCAQMQSWPGRRSLGSSGTTSHPASRCKTVLSKASTAACVMSA